MRNARQVIKNLFLSLTLVAACAASAGARADDERVISARAGGVNFVSGEVTFRRAGQDAWQQLATTDELRRGDAVRTGADGRAEILLNPGSYLRLGENSEFELTDPSLDSLRLKLSKGSALVEAAGYRDAEVAMAFDTPRASVSLVRSGVYRFNVGSSGATEVFVRKGRALVGAGQTLLKEGAFARVGASGVAEVGRFDRDEQDALDVWSKGRARELARAQSKLRMRQVNAAFARSSGWNSWGLSSSGLFGVWYRGGDCYTFLPFYFYTSPYGFAYDMELPAFAYLCGSCNRRWGRPWGTVWASNPTSTTYTSAPPTPFTKPAKTVDSKPDFGGSSYSKGDVHAPPSGGGGGTPVGNSGAPAKGTIPPPE